MTATFEMWHANIYSDFSSFGRVLSPTFQMSVWIVPTGTCGYNVFQYFYYYFVALFPRTAKIRHCGSKRNKRYDSTGLLQLIYRCSTGLLEYTQLQCCCGAETICFRSGSDFQKVLAPEPAPATALELSVITDFMLKSTFFMFLWKKIDLIYMLDPIQFE
jgi:hypothetical protein